MALKPGSPCPCGCRCAVPLKPTAKGCPCPCGCSICASRGARTQAESAPTRPTAGRTQIRESRETPMTATTRPVTEAEFKVLLEAITNARAAAPAPVIAEPPLHTLSNDQLGARLVRRLAENHASPYWAQVRENAGSTGTAAPAGLAEQAQALPIAQHAMTLSEALASAHDLHSPGWTRTPPRSVFTEPGR